MAPLRLHPETVWRSIWPFCPKRKRLEGTSRSERPLGLSILYSKPISGRSGDGRKVSSLSTHGFNFNATWGRRNVVAKQGTRCRGCLLAHVSWAVTWRPFAAAARGALHLNRRREGERPPNSVKSERAPWTRCPAGRHRRPDPCIRSAPPTRPRTFVESPVRAADQPAEDGVLLDLS